MVNKETIRENVVEWGGLALTIIKILDSNIIIKIQYSINSVISNKDYTTNKLYSD